MWPAFVAALFSVTELPRVEPTSFAALALATIRLTALIALVSHLSPSGRRGPTALAAALLGLELYAMYTRHLLGHPVPAVVHPIAIVLACALALVLTRRGPPVVPPDEGPALGKMSGGLVALAAIAIGGGIGVTVVRKLTDVGFDAGLTAAALLAAPTLAVALYLLRAIQRVGRNASVASCALTAAVVIEVLQGIAYFRACRAYPETPYGDWLGAAGMLGPALTAFGLLSLGARCNARFREHLLPVSPLLAGSSVAAAAIILVGTLVLQGSHVIAPTWDWQDQIAYPGYTVASAALPWLAAALCAPQLFATARLPPLAPPPPRAVATP
jgi:hypothetical protein